MRKLSVVLLLLFIFQSAFFAQEKPPADKESMEKLKDSLEVLKKELSELKAIIEQEIFRLRKSKDSLDSQILEEQKELYIVKYGKENGVRVASGMVWKGMTEEMLRDSWGEPDKIDSNKQPYGIFNQWYYGEVTYFFRDGKLIDWEEGKVTEE
jgi:hypothetical protein